MNGLRGLTWKHDRGLAPLLATAREFERTDGVSIAWEARSLHEFGDVSVAGAAGQYDLIVIDHPFMGEAARDGFLHPWDDLVDASVLTTLRAESVGASHESYGYSGHQWALAIDAASQVSGYRQDLLDGVGASVPRSWEDVFALSKIRPGFVTPALLPLDSMMCFFSLCANAGVPPMVENSDELVASEVGEAMLERLRELAKNALPDALASNPIAIWERMSSTDDIAYCPLAFGYSNYSRNGYRTHQVQFTNIPSDGHGPVGATLGGAGLAITKRCTNVPAAVKYGKWIASAECQRGLYVQAGGQPGNRVAWIDTGANALCNGYFGRILPTLESAYVRPRFSGFVDFQTAGGKLVWESLRGDQSPRAVMESLNKLYRTWPK